MSKAAGVVNLVQRPCSDRKAELESISADVLTLTAIFGWTTEAPLEDQPRHFCPDVVQTHPHTFSRTKFAPSHVFATELVLVDILSPLMFPVERFPFSHPANPSR